MRIFRCDRCEDKPVLGSRTCGSCGKPVTILNWIYTHLAVIVGILAFAVYQFIR